MVHILVNLMVSDEQRENSLKAIYLLGQIGFYLGSVRDYNELILIVSLLRLKTEIQY